MSSLAGSTTSIHAFTFEGLSVFVRECESFNSRQRNEKLTALRMLVRIIGRCTGSRPLLVSAIRCDVSWLNDCLFKLPPKAHGLSKQSFGNVITHLRKLLRQMDLLDPESCGLSENSSWRQPLKSLQEAACRLGLARFAAWCDAAGVAPGAVTNEILAAFEQHIRTRHLRPDIPGFIGSLVKNWRKAGIISAAWPSSRIEAPPRKELYRFSISDFPPAVQKMVYRYQQHLSGQDRRGPFAGDGPIKSLRPPTVEKRVYGLKLALNAYVEVRGLDPSQVTSIEALLEPDAFEEILLFHWNRAVARRIAAGDLDPRAEPAMDAGNTSHTAAVATAVMIMAKHVCKLPESDLTKLGRLAASVQPGSEHAVGRRTAAILDRLLEPRNRFNLLRLPVKLMKAADAMTDQPYKAALMAMMAVAIEIELNKPLRLTNLTRLRLGEELQFTDPRLQRPTHLKIRSQNVKNRVDIEWPLSEQLGNLIAHYLRHHRANLGGADTAWLFPGCRSDGSRHAGSIRAGLKDAIAEHIGVHIHPHIFRAFVGCLLLDANPGALEDLRQLLDHKTLQTSLSYYAYLQPAVVAHRVDQVLAEGRAGQSLGALAKGGKASLRKPRR